VTLSSSVTTAHYVFHFASTDAVDSARQEAFHEWFTALFGVVLDRPIQYNKYQSRAALRAATGQDTNGFADPATFTVHTIWPFDAHESIHVYTATFGRPTDFFNEGIATGLSTDPIGNRFTPWWNAQPLDDLVRGFRQAGRLPSLSSIVESTSFRALDDQIGYPVAGSFMAFVVSTYGVEPTKAFFRSGARDNTLAQIRVSFGSAFGVALETAEQDWLRRLTGSS